MAQKKIITNVSGSDYEIIGKVLSNNEQYDVEAHFWLELTKSSTILDDVLNGNLIVSDGIRTLAARVGREHLATVQGVIFEHNDITLLPLVTENAPELIKISDASIGFRMEIGDEIYGQSRIDNYAGGVLQIQLHLCADNIIADRWAKFDISYILTDGLGNRNMNVIDNVRSLGPIEISTTPYQIMEKYIEIPENEVLGANYVFIGVKRVAATGKTEVTNSPIVLRYCKRYYKKLGT